MRTYDLDFETLVALLKNAHQTGVLSTRLPAGYFGQKKPCLVKINLVEGEITYCHVEDENGNIQITGNIDTKLLNVLYNLGICSWLLDTDPLTIHSLNASRNAPDSPPFLQPTPPFSQNTPSFSQPAPQNAPSFSQPTPSFSQTQATGYLGTRSMPRRFFSDVPHISTNISPEILQTLSRRHRRVLGLVDGKRSAEKIAALLFAAPKDAWIVLTLLQEMEAMRIITWANR